MLIIDGNEGEWVVIAHCRNLEERQYDIISPWESIAMATKNRFFFFLKNRVQYKVSQSQRDDF